MICIICALYPEAQPFIKALELKQDKANKYYKKYNNDEKDICLYITGPGPLNAATAVGYVFSENETCLDSILMLNIGSCALISKEDTGSKGLYLCNKLVNIDSGRAFYPDMLLRSDLDEAMILTGSKIYEAENGLDQGFWDVSKDPYGEYSTTVLYDMEGAAVYEAASHFIGPHQMHFLKFVTDKGDGRITADCVRSKAEDSLDEVINYIEMLKDHNPFLDDTSIDNAEESRICKELHASVSMQFQIRQLLRYADLAGIDYNTMLSDLRNKQILPCKDKRQGLRILEIIRKYISDGNAIDKHSERMHRDFVWKREL